MTSVSIQASSTTPTLPASLHMTASLHTTPDYMLSCGY